MAAYRDRLFVFVRDLTRSEVVAEELVMDVFMKIWMGRELLPEVENINAFLYRVARNKAIDFLRKAAKDDKLMDALARQFSLEKEQSADSLLMIKEYEGLLREAVSLMPPQRKQAWKLSREENLTHDQIAARMQISPATVNTHINEAKRFIRQHLSRGMDLALVLALFSDN